MDKPLIRFATQSEHITEKDPPREILRVRLDPQTHEIILTPDMFWRQALDNRMSPEQARDTAMIELLRGQALCAYDMVMQAGLTALANEPRTAADIETAMSHYVESSGRAREEAEKERDSWKELAERRKIEIDTLERVLRRS